MKNIALSTLILFTFFLSHSIVAQDDPVAKKLVKEVLNKVESYDNLVIDFSYTLENQEQDLKQETRGDVSIKGDKYVLNLMGTTQIFDGNKIYTIVPEDEEVTISSYDKWIQIKLLLLKC